MSGTAPPATNRRQPVRQTRANPARANLPRPYGRRVSLGDNEPQRPTGPPGFFPAITHFTDTITALPKEIVRHFTLLKEVDAKAYGPEETLHQLSEVALNAPLPPRNEAPGAQRSAGDDTPGAVGSSEAPGVNGATGPTSAPVPTLQQQPAPPSSQQQQQRQSADDESDLARRRVFYNLRYLITEMLLTLDEKNHVIATATEALNKQLQRMESSYPYIDNEISEEARCGSLNHWAYADRINAKSHPPPAERSRRDVASANNLAAAAAALHEREAAASRSESRREAMLARKQRTQHADSDFDDRRRGPGGGAKVRRTAADSAVDGKGLALDTLGAAQPSKRRRTDKAAGGAAMERSLSQALNGGSGKGGLGSPRATPDPTKKRTKTSTGQTRKRNTAASGARSPSVASSPVQPSFPGGRDFPVIGGSSQRPQSSRARQNSNQSMQQDGSGVAARHRPSSSASNKLGTSNGLPPGTPEVNSVAGLTGRSVADVKVSMKESITPKGEHVIEEAGHEQDPDHLRGALVMGGSSGSTRNASKDSGWTADERVSTNLKREDTESNGDYKATRGGVDNTGLNNGNNINSDNGATSLPLTAAGNGTTRAERANGSSANNGGSGDRTGSGGGGGNGGAGGGRASKTSTPTMANFPDPTTTSSATAAASGIPTSSGNTHHHHRSSRPSRASESGASGAPVKRSHKKGGSAAAAAAAAAVAAQQAHHLGGAGAAGSPRLGSGSGSGTTGRGNASGNGALAGAAHAALDEEDEVDDDAEPRYCYCNQVSYGEMVACDADDCPREWFHLDCVGLSKAPTKNAKWYCDECKENLKRSKGISGR